jgi:hypothetical protein
MKVQSLVLPALLSIAFASCKHELPFPNTPEETNPTTNNGNGNNGGNTNPDPADTIVCFESEILPIFQSSCASTGCHDAITHEEGLRLYTYNNIRQDIVPNDPTNGDIMEAILDNDPDKIMPPPPHAPLSQSQIALIQQWIMQGANNTTNCDPSSCDSTAFRYSADIAPIMSTHCNGCHSGAFPSGGIVTSTHSGLSATISSGSLLGSIEHTYPYSAMPKNAAQLDLCKRTKIRKWAEVGAQNN